MESNKKDIKEENIDVCLRSFGILLPTNENELNSFDNLNSNFEYKLDDSKINLQAIFEEVSKEEHTFEINHCPKSKNIYFKRVVLAAEIANQLYNEPTFGHVKFQKIVYLCEQANSMQLDDRYCKQAAGPYDRKFMHTIDFELEKQNWFSVKKDNTDKYGRYVFKPLDGLLKYKDYYKKYYSNDDNIQLIINLFKKEKTNFVELVATLYSCWTEIITNNDTFSEELILKKLYAWSKEKKKYSEIEVIKTITWMRDKSLIPIELS